MTNEDLIAWYRNQPLNHALASMLHDLREPFEAFGAIAALIQQFSNQATRCTTLAAILRQAIATLVEQDMNDDLWAVCQAIARQLPSGQLADQEQSPLWTWDQPLDVVVAQIARRMRATMTTIRHTIQPLQGTCLECLPGEIRESIGPILERKFDEFLQRLAVLEAIIVPRIKAEVIEQL